MGTKVKKKCCRKFKKKGKFCKKCPLQLTAGRCNCAKKKKKKEKKKKK